MNGDGHPERTIVKSADWIIDLGPGAGDAGGQVIAEGTPEDVAENAQSLTGSYLKRRFLIDAARAYARQPSERAA
jgi:excinuclease ABC subunit A